MRPFKKPVKLFAQLHREALSVLDTVPSLYFRVAREGTQHMFDNLKRRSPSQYYGTFSASPIILFTLGAAALFFGLVAVVVEIRTSELLVLGGKAEEIPWGVFLQPYLLVMGTDPILTKMAWLYGWGIEIIGLIFAFAFNHATNALSQTNARIAKMYGVVSFLLILLNGWANFHSLPGVDPLIQVLVAVVVAIAVIAFPVIGLALIERGFEELGD